MTPLTLHEIATLTGAPRPEASATISFISTDTRTLKPGSLFVAIRGETHDGHAHLAAAAKAGAVAALVERTPPDAPEHLTLLLVPDARRAMGQLAAFVRRNLKATVIAVGGANGKTGTKNLIDSILASAFRGSMSEKSFNNDIGVPVTLFNADPAHDYVVLEMGTNHHGELKPLSEMGAPDIAVITNIAAEHLEGLGDLEGVRREEASLLAGLRPTGLLVVNGDDPGLLPLVIHFPGKRLTFGRFTDNDLFPTHIHLAADGVRFRLNANQEFFIPLLGRHVAINACAAIAVARHMGMTDRQIAQALAQARGPDMRLQIDRAGLVTVLNDAYNANPASVRAALDTLAALPAPARRVAVLGDMRELGHASDPAHREVGTAAAASSLDLLVCVGTQARLIADSALAAGFPAAALLQYPDTPSAAAALPALLGQGDLVLLKGSRYMKLETIAAALRTTPPPQGPLKKAS